MRTSILACIPFVLAAVALPAGADVTVRLTEGRVDLVARNAPLSEVLDRLAKETGMTVLYSGPVAPEIVTLTLSGRRPAEAIEELLKERTLNYALAVEASGRVRTLIVTPRAGALAKPAASAPSPSFVLDWLKTGRPPGASKTQKPAAEAKPQDVLPPGLRERFAGAATPAPAAAPEGSLLQLFLQRPAPPAPPTPAPPRTP
jgi:hypothetical protein